jgi:invasion protein IalB
MLKKLRSLRNMQLGVIFFLVGASTNYAQDATGPLFSTPAGRSTTGAPILIKPENQNGGTIVDSVGGGAKSRIQNDVQKNDRKQQTSAPNPVNGDKLGAKTFGDWDVQCVGQPKGGSRCQIVGDVMSADGKQAILVMSLAPALETKTIAIQMAVPLGVAVQAGVKVDIDEAYSGSMPISRCTPQGCLVEGVVPVEMIEGMKAKSVALIGVTTPDGKNIPITLSLKGFRSAYDAVMGSGKSGQ